MDHIPSHCYHFRAHFHYLAYLGRLQSRHSQFNQLLLERCFLLVELDNLPVSLLHLVLQTNDLFLELRHLLPSLEIVILQLGRNSRVLFAQCGTTQCYNVNMT